MLDSLGHSGAISSKGATPEHDQSDLPEHLQVGVVAVVAVVDAAGPPVGEPVDDAVAAGHETVKRHRHVQDQPPLRVPAHPLTTW